MQIDAADFVDTERYPVDGPGLDRNALVADVRSELETHGCAVLKGFVRAERIAALVAECDRVASHPGISTPTTTPSPWRFRTPNRYWFSIADSDVAFWSSAIAAERGLDVEISEPDVSPLAVQGPLAEDVVASLLGDWVRELRYFGFADADIDGIPMKVARSGWSNGQSR